jgi:hypothetical protein
VDDLLDRAKDVEENATDAVKDVTNDDDDSDSVDMVSLQASLAALQAKVEELSGLPSRAAKGSAAAKASTLPHPT